MNLVLFGKQYFHIIGYRPFNTDVGIVPHKTALVRRVVITCAFIYELSLVGKHYKAVGKALGNIELLLVFG